MEINNIFLTSTFLPNPGANGLITQIIVEDFNKKENNSAVISIKSASNELDAETINETSIYRISSSKFQKKYNLYRSSAKRIDKILLKLLFFKRKALNIINIMNFPNFDKDQNVKTYKRVKEVLTLNNKVKNIIAIHKPYSNIAAIKKVKKEYPHLICGIYFLDLLNDMKKPKFIPTYVYNNLLKREYINILNTFDYIIIPQATECYFKKFDYFGKYNKFYISDFPTLKTETIDQIEKDYNLIEEKNISFLYAGTIDKTYRNPEVLLKVFNKLTNKNNNYIINIFGKNNCEELFNEYTENTNIYNRGFQNKEIINHHTTKADFLINISNSLEYTVPSKIFELFSTGKPIINFVSTKEDKTLNYFYKYPAVFNFFEWRDIDEQLIELEKFIHSYMGYRVPLELIQTNFQMNIPRYTTNIIRKAINQSQDT